MGFPKSFIEQLKKQTDLKQLIEEFAKDIEWIKYSSTTYGAICPHPKHHDHDPSFRFWPQEQSWSCMSCHSGKKTDKNEKTDHIIYGSDCIAFVRWMKGYSYPQAVRFLAKRINMPLPEEDKEVTRQLHDNGRLANSYAAGRIDIVNAYLKDRGLTVETMDKWKIGWCIDRITFPLINRFDQVVGFTRRLLNYEKGMEHPKYRNSKASKIFNKSEFLYGENFVNRNYEYIFITEGPMDVILASQHGVKNVVASLGTAFTEGHADIVANMGLRPVVLMDGDEKGIQAIHRAAKLLHAKGVSFNVIELPEGMDLADYALLKQDNLYDALMMLMQPYSMYCLKDVLSKYEAKMQEIKIKLYPEVLKAAQYVTDKEERALMSDLLYDKMKITLH